MSNAELLDSQKGKTISEIENLTNDFDQLEFVIWFTDGTKLRVGSRYKYDIGGSTATIYEYQETTMYYEELMINGVMCYRSTPNGEWRVFTVDKLHTRIAELTHECNKLKLNTSNATNKITG